MAVDNTKALCFILGWQGGTIHQAADRLGVSVAYIIDADEVAMDDLMRLAQKRRTASHE